MPREEVGQITCPVCDHPDASVRMSSAKKPKPYIVCDECGYQGFARGDKAAEAMIRKARMHQAQQQDQETKKPVPQTTNPPKQSGSFLGELFNAKLLVD